MSTRTTAIEPVLTTKHPGAQCVDLRRTFGKRYRYGWDDAHETETPARRKTEAQWLTRILCTHGWIFPMGGRTLGAYSESPRKGRELERLFGQELNRGREAFVEACVTFDVADIDKAADLLQARRPRVYSPEERARRAARLAKARDVKKVRELLHTGGVPTDQERRSDAA